MPMEPMSGESLPALPSKVTFGKILATDGREPRRHLRDLRHHQEDVDGSEFT